MRASQCARSTSSTSHREYYLIFWLYLCFSRLLLLINLYNLGSCWNSQATNLLGKSTWTTNIVGRTIKVYGRMSWGYWRVLGLWANELGVPGVWADNQRVSATTWSNESYWLSEQNYSEYISHQKTTYTISFSWCQLVLIIQRFF